MTGRELEYLGDGVRQREHRRDPRDQYGIHIGPDAQLELEIVAAGDAAAGPEGVAQHIEVVLRRHRADGAAAVDIGQHQPERVAELLQPAQGVGGLVFPVVADHAHAAALGEAREHRMLDPAFHAPAAPDVEQIRRAAQLLVGDVHAGIMQHGE